MWMWIRFRFCSASNCRTVGALDPEIYRDAIEARFDRLLAAEFDDGPLSDLVAWLAGKAALPQAERDAAVS